MSLKPLLTAVSAVGCALLAGGVHYGISLREIRRQSARHPEFWASRLAGQDAHGIGRALSYVALGDSAATGVGVADPEAGYVTHVEKRLEQISGRPVRTANLSVPGASTWLLMEDQLPLFEQLPEPDVVTCIIGGNDIIDPNFTAEGFEWTLARLFPRLPAGTVVSTVPSFGVPPFETRVQIANALIRRYARDNDLYLADIHSATRALWPVKYFFHVAGDFFHPNARGHRVWADAVWEAVERSYAGRFPAHALPAAS